MKNEKIISQSEVTLNVVLKLTETQARALNAITVYGSKAFLEGYYKQLGTHYMQPYEKGLIELFEVIREEMPAHFNKIDKARAALKEKL